MKNTFAILTALLLLPPTAVHASEFHVATDGNDANSGARNAALRTIQRAADLAQAGDVITVHEGIYRERITPPRGGESDAKRIVYQAAPGEKVVITGSEVVKNWTKVQGDVWTVTVPNTFFGTFNPFSEKVHGDWFDPLNRTHHRGCVYVGGDWLTEAAKLDDVLKPGAIASGGGYLPNVAWLRTAGRPAPIPADRFTEKHGMNTAPCSEGGTCLGYIQDGDWVRFDGVDFGERSESVEIRAASLTGGGTIELRDGSPTGDLLGSCQVAATGDWQAWESFNAMIKPTSGVKSLCLVFRKQPATALWFGEVDTANTTLWAQFKDVNPNNAEVEINVRPTVFTPEKTNIDYITVRGFDLRNAASNWAAPTSGQQGLVTAYWCKGWIIENNEIHHSRCSGIALGKYSDQHDGTRATKEGYDGTIADALATGGWTKEKIGGHIVRNNHIHHCGQTGIVGSLGCAFSRIENNDIHDINKQGIWGGLEMAGIKFHGAIDVVIKGNHIYNCGGYGGLWLDWMAQGTQVIGNLFHNNVGQDIFAEVNHGPFLIANNIMLSPGAYVANSQGGAFAHNLITGKLTIMHDDRQTPYHKAHSTELVGRHDCPIGDARWYNNLLAGQCKLNACDGAVLPVAAAGNVFTKGAQPSKFDREAFIKPDFDPGVSLTRRADGWYLAMTTDAGWTTGQARKVVTSDLLGKAVIPNLPFENPDGSPVLIDTDYFGKKRNERNPGPGPFECSRDGKIDLKVW